MPSTPSSAAPEPSRRWVLAVALLVLALVGSATFWLSRGDDTTSAPRLGDCSTRVSEGEASLDTGLPAPTFELPALDGTCFDLAAFAGRPLVINFWASWCHPCRTEFPLLADARERYEDADLEVIGVLSRDHILSDARQFADERDVEWPLVVDDDDVVGKAYGVRSIPETFFVAADGTLIAHVFGLTAPKELDRQIKRTLDA